VINCKNAIVKKNLRKAQNTYNVILSPWRIKSRILLVIMGYLYSFKDIQANSA